MEFADDDRQIDVRRQAVEARDVALIRVEAHHVDIFRSLSDDEFVRSREAAAHVELLRRQAFELLTHRHEVGVDNDTGERLEILRRRRLRDPSVPLL